jgi:leucyl aminopeptidase
MDYFTTTSDASKRATDCVIVGVYDSGKLSAGATEIDAASGGELRRLVKSGDVSSRPGRCVLLRNLGGVKASRVAVAGLGKQGEFDTRKFCRAVAATIGSVSESKCHDILNTLTLEDVAGANLYYLARQTAQMKSGKKNARMPLKKIGLSVADRGAARKAMLGAKHGDGIVGGVSFAKDLGNLPPNVCTPTYLARAAQKLAKGNGKLTTRILNESDMKRLGMHSLLSVTAGSSEPAKMIVMQYKNGGRSKPIVLVGKGVTFDSGGISLKPGPAMDEMKFDMCGAAGVLGTMATVAALELPVNLNVVVPAVENLPGSKATVPGDIVKSMSGQTIEILNTDAEGRLILCDALTYSRRFKPDVIIDVATLTGACVIALGQHHSGVMSYDDGLADEIVKAGVHASDRAWRLPLSEEYSEQLKSNFADFANVGGRDGGAITAGCFLGKFTDGLKWAHLDIAGTAWKSGQKKGATGRPVPLLSELILSRCNALP